VKRLACALAAGLALAGCTPRDPGPPLTRIIDGDTVEVRYIDLPLAVRMVGVDAPESVHPDAERNSEEGREATAWLRGKLSGRRVRVEFARRSDGTIATDLHHRALAWIWVDGGLPGRDTRDHLINEEMVREGVGRFLDYPEAAPHARALREAEAEARAARRGVWLTPGNP
jgi:micrococcal nuclease